MYSKRKRNDAGERGVALIIVLGFLSLMVMMALAFITQARVERQVARSTLDANRGRQLARTAIYAAMNDYSVELWNNLLMLPPPDSDYDVFVSAPNGSSMKSGRTLGDDNVRLLVGEARRWIPRTYLTSSVSNVLKDAEWVLVREDPTKSTSRILGRYAYACFDMSGGIDANLVALSEGVANQGNGDRRASVRDVGMGLLPETADASAFKSLRRGWHGFDNLAELILLTNGKYNGGEQDYEDEDLDDTAWSPPGDARWRGNRVEYSPGLTSSKISDLVPYSLAGYRGVWDFGSATWKRNDIQSIDDPDIRWTTVLDEVADQLVNEAQTVKTLEDYVSASAAPAGVDYPSSKAVPMFNELGTTVKAKMEGTNIQLQVELEFETWYPFDSKDNPDQQSFTIKAPTIGGNSSTAKGDADLWFLLLVRSAVSGNVRVEALEGSPSSPELQFESSFSGGSPKSAGKLTYDLSMVTVGSNVFANGDTVVIRTMANGAPIQMFDASGMLVDQMSFDALTMNVNLTVGGDVDNTYYLEVDDPRLNHDVQHWSDGDGTMGEVNKAATYAGYGEDGGEGLYMYCRNGVMQTPAELGYISTGNPWSTIDLCTPEGAEMLSKLVVTNRILEAIRAETNHYTYYTNGTINPNTSSTTVLASAFAYLNMTESTNSAQTADVFSEEEALELATAITQETKSKKIESKEKGAFMSSSDWVRVPALKKGGTLAKKGFNKNQREGLIRRTWGLFSPNNSMFTVVVIAQPISEGPERIGIWGDDDMVVGERRAVALVWRDPTPSASSSGATRHDHEMFIRMFKFLDE